MVRRLVIMRAVVVLIFALILLRLMQLQVVEGAHNRRLADENRIRVVRRLAPRGNIRDRQNRVLAGSRLAFSVCVVPEELGLAGGSDAVVSLARILGAPVSEVRARLAKGEATVSEPIVLWRNASADVVARLEEQAVYWSGVSVLAEAVRYYPHGSLAAHAIGYVREIGPEELALAENAGYRRGDLIGKAGIERVAERALRGIDGGDQIEVDAAGHPVRTLEAVPAQRGREVWLTLDLDLQQAAEEALGDRAGAVVAMDPDSGEVLALASHPAYDPNLFVGALTAAQWRRLSGPLAFQHNRATNSGYPPGSVFKPITAAAALEAGVCETDSRFYCGGSYGLGKWRLHCWKRDGHGSVDFVEGFAQSCNVMFATLGARTGPDRLGEMARRFGLGEKRGIDLPQEAGGLVPSPAWKRERRHEAWYPGDTCQMAIGQGDCLVTPVQAACAFAAIANGGYLVQPHLIARIEGESGRVSGFERQSVDLRPEIIAALRGGLEAVVAPGGTAHNIATPRYTIAGKTGTAESGAGRDHAWFAGYAPAERPRVVVAVIVEHGGHGGRAAAPVARHVFDTALLAADERPAWPGRGSRAAVTPGSAG